MRVAYFLQTHRQSAEICRLLAVLRAGSPDAVLVVGHDPSGAPLAPESVEAFGAVLFRPAQPARRGEWSLLQPYISAVERLDRLGVAYEWLVYLSGQDYPVRPLAASEAELASSPFDGYLDWRPIDAPSADGRRRQGRLRYTYRYRRLGSPWIAPFLHAFNGIQPWWHLHATYGPRLGRRVRPAPFGPGFSGYWGSQWTTLRRCCAEVVAEAGRAGSPLAAHFAATVCPDEAFAQTVLVNDARWRLCNDDLRFADHRGSRDGRPRVLGVADLPVLLSGRYAFARKFDPAVDAAVLDRLDEAVLGSRRGAA